MNGRPALLIGLLAFGVTRPTAGQTLHGSPSSVDLMYDRARSTELDFFGTPQAIYDAASKGRLKMLSFTNDVALDEVGYPFVLPRTFDFVNRFARQYAEGCGERLVITSASRPTDDQPRNASPKSVHPTGMAVDFKRPGGACLTWLRGALLSLEDQHLIEATEERHPPHFHVAVLQAPPLHLAIDPGTKDPLARQRRVKSMSAGEVSRTPRHATARKPKHTTGSSVRRRKR
jgi:hypothetical protein